MNRTLGRAARLQRLEELLLSNPAGYSVTELANRTRVDRSTVYRDIELMSANGVPIYQDGSLYSIDRSQYLSNVRLASGESLMLYLAMRQAVRRLTHIPPMMASVLEKLIIAIRDEQLRDKLIRALQAMQDQRPPT